jgi:hypothetical protein
MKKGQKPRLDEARNNIPQICQPDPHVADVYKLLCRGLNRATIIAYAESKAWGSSDLQIDDYIDAATAELAKAAGVDTEAELGKSLERLNDLFMNAHKVHDFKTALQIQKEINKTLELKLKAARSGRPAGQASEPRQGIALVK